MESFVKSLFERLDQASQAQLICIMDNAINEMHNNGIISRVTPEIAAKLHDPDPNVRVTEKTSLAKSVGYSFVVSSKPGVTENGICHTVEINNDVRFPNSIAICIQGGLEGLYQSGIYKKTKSGIMDYRVIIHKNGQDSSSLEQNLNVLNNLYDEFNIIINVDEVTQNNSSNNDTNNAPSYQNTTTRTDYFDEMCHYKQINRHNTFEGKNSNASKFSESIFWRFIGILCLIFFLLLTFSASPIFIIGVVAVILAWYFIHKKKRHSNNKDK